jgi:hypothetical protein
MSRTPLCKVCQDAGKPESVFRSHFTRQTPDPHSKVVCPTLLAQECRYCFKKGHTVKYCSVLKADNKALEKTKNADKKPVVKPPTIKKPQNCFSCLDCDSDEDEDEPVQEPVQNQVTYASVLLQQKTAQLLKKFDEEKASKYININTPKIDDEEDEKPAPKLAPWATKVNQSTNKWAGMESDSEDEDDEYQTWLSLEGNM